MRRGTRLSSSRRRPSSSSHLRVDAGGMEDGDATMRPRMAACAHKQPAAGVYFPEFS